MINERNRSARTAVRAVRRHAFSTLAAGTAAVIGLAPAARAEDAGVKKLESEIQRIEAQHRAEIQTLRAEIRQLRRQGLVVTGAQAPPAVAQPTQHAILPGAPGLSQQAPFPPNGVPAPALPPKVLMTYDRGYHFGFSDAAGSNTIELFGRLHLDTAGYLGFKPGPGTLDQKALADGLDLRRARIGVVGNFMTDWHYAFVYDLGNTADGNNPENALANANSGTSPTTSNNYLAGVENAVITYNGFYQHGQPYPVAFDAGFQDVPWTLGEATSSNDTLFMERSSAQVVATEFGGGDFRSALDVRSNNNRYWVGAFLTGPNSGALHTAGASCNTGTGPVTPGTPCVTGAQMTGLGPQLSFLARGAYQIVQTNDATLHVGFDYANLFHPRVGANVQAIQLYDRPELRVDPTYFLNTGNIPATGGQVFGVEAAASLFNFFVQGEYFHYMIDTRAGVPTTPGNLQGGVPGAVLNFNGGYVEASYTFGGRRRYDPSKAAYTGVIPQSPLAPGYPGWGALEIAGRFSIVDLNSPSLTTATLGPAYTAPGVITGGTNSYGGGQQTSYGVGLNWYPNLNMKFMLDYEHVVVDNPQLFGGSTNYRGATIDWLAARTQLVF